MTTKQSKKFFLTEKGLIELTEQLEELKKVKRPQVIEELKEARALGDLSENSEYDAAREAQAMVEGKIKELEYMLENATIINNEDKSKVQIGSTVKVKYIADDDCDEFTIVGSQEADPFENKISNESPLAQALLGSKKDDIVTVSSPNGDYDLEIVEIN